MHCKSAHYDFEVLQYFLLLYRISRKAHRLLGLVRGMSVIFGQ